MQKSTRQFTLSTRIMWTVLDNPQINFSVCIHVLHIVNGCSFNIETLKPSMTEQVFFSFFFSMVTVLDVNKMMKFLKLGEYHI